jgi:hypothetical protein
VDGDGKISFQTNHLRIRSVSIFVLAVVLLITLFKPVLAVTIYPGTEFEVENETYTVYQVMVFSSITISDTFIIFNSTGFYIDSPNDITITLKFIDSNFYQASNGDLVLQFYANTNTGNVLFDISGFPLGARYEVRRDSTVIANPTADSSGFIYFSNNVWSSHLFSIYQVNKGSDMIPSTISNIALACSNPKDTDSAYGWENITCKVTDNVGVEQVKINILYPSGSSINVSMNQVSGTNNYYYKTSFSQFGSHSYYIWAIDTSGNGKTSGSNIFSLPPNWDVDGDGQCRLMDLTLVSNRYTELGSHGWIREDVDNNGAVRVFDLVQVSNHYDETWS